MPISKMMAYITVACLWVGCASETSHSNPTDALVPPDMMSADTPEFGVSDSSLGIDEGMEDMEPADADLTRADQSLVDAMPSVQDPYIEVRHGEMVITSSAQIECGSLRQLSDDGWQFIGIRNSGGRVLEIEAYQLEDTLRVRNEDIPLNLEPGEEIVLEIAPRTDRYHEDLRGRLRITSNATNQPDFDILFSAHIERYVRDRAEPDPGFRRLLDTLRDQHQLVGMGAAVVRDGDIVALEGVGYEDLAGGVFVDPRETRFRWASLSKTLAGVLTLINDDTVDLDDSIDTYYEEYRVPSLYLPDACRAEACALMIRPAQRRITLRQLLSNTGGIQHYQNGAGNPSPPTESINNPEINTGIEWALSYFIQRPLVAIPGTEYRYSSFGFNLAGVVLERALGDTYANLVAQNISEPLGLRTLRPDREWEEIPRRAVGYLQGRGGVPVIDGSDDVSWKLPGGGFISTVKDLATYCGGLNGDVLLDERTRLNPLWTAADNAPFYGLGFRVYRPAGRLFVKHLGSQQKAVTSLRLYPEEGLCFILMSNTRVDNIDDIAAEAEALWRGLR